MQNTNEYQEGAEHGIELNMSLAEGYSLSKVRF